MEIDEKAVRTYNAIFKSELPLKTQDVRGWNLKPDILIHGSPCQDFSIAGYRKGGDVGSGTRSSLMWETVNIIKQMGVWKPKIVIWENVKSVLFKKTIKTFNKYLFEMEKLGYTNNYEILDARNFGLPQARERVFTVSTLGKTLFNFGHMETKKAPHINEYLQDVFEEKYIITQPSMLKKIGNFNGKAFDGRLTPITDHCKTITTKQLRCPNSGIVPIGDGKYRLLTERECWLLQGYSDEDFDAALSVNPTKRGCLNGVLYKQSGNSIPVPIFESMFNVML